MRTTIFLALLLQLSTALSADLCVAIALVDVHSLQDPTSILKQGEEIEAVSQYNVNRKTGISSFCQHGGYCYPEYTNKNGKKTKALKLTNCIIENTASSDDEDDYYGLIVDRSKNSNDALRQDDLENKLIEMGLCNACADNVAEFYLKKPSSPCAKLTKKALEGNPVAKETLLEAPDYCSLK